MKDSNTLPDRYDWTLLKLRHERARAEEMLKITREAIEELEPQLLAFEQFFHEDFSIRDHALEQVESFIQVTNWAPIDDVYKVVFEAAKKQMDYHLKQEGRWLAAIERCNQALRAVVSVKENREL